MKSAVMILAMEILGAAAVSIGAGLVFPPAGIISAGIFLLVFAIAVERSRAQ
jgi:hypothetical protein